jgi:hypothetical protein
MKTPSKQLQIYWKNYYVYSTLHVSAHTGHHQALFKYKDTKRRKINFVMSYPIADRDRSFGITTRYGWTAQGSNPGGGRDFRHPSRPAHGTVSCKMGTGSLRGRNGWGVACTTPQHHLALYSSSGSSLVGWISPPFFLYYPTCEFATFILTHLQLLQTLKFVCHFALQLLDVHWRINIQGETSHIRRFVTECV